MIHVGLLGPPPVPAPDVSVCTGTCFDRRVLWLLAGWALLGSLPSLVLLAMSYAMARHVPRLEDQTDSLPAEPPRLSVVVPACNEAATIEPALASLLRQDYPNLEIIVVDDRSTDETGAIVDRIAAEDQRVVAEHVKNLPEGWLGKVHALHHATKRAGGDLILFTDADVVFEQDCLTRAVAYTEARGVDHLFVLPRLHSHSVFVELMVGAAVRGVCLSQRPWRAVDPKREEAVGGGAFNMVRRSAFERTPGFEWLRLEVADDLALGHLMKKYGGRPSVLVGTNLLHVQWYRSVREAFRGLEKNAFAQLARFSLWRGLSFALLGTLIAVGPYLSFFVPMPYLWTAGVLAFACNGASAAILRRWAGTPFITTFLSVGLGDLLMVGVVLRATLLGWRRQGVVWRGTHYPSELLQKGVRVRF